MKKIKRDFSCIFNIFHLIVFAQTFFIWSRVLNCYCFMDVFKIFLKGLKKLKRWSKSTNGVVNSWTCLWRIIFLKDLCWILMNRTWELAPNQQEMWVEQISCLISTQIKVSDHFSGLFVNPSTFFDPFHLYLRLEKVISIWS